MEIEASSTFNPITCKYDDSAVEASRYKEEHAFLTSLAHRQALLKHGARGGGFTYPTGRVANSSIVSKHSPVFFNQPLRNNAASFDGVEHQLHGEWERVAPKVVPRPNFDKTLEPSWKEVRRSVGGGVGVKGGREGGRGGGAEGRVEGGRGERRVLTSVHVL